MALRIAFDLDGVLADMESELVNQAERLFGGAIPGRPPERRADRTTTAAPPPSSDAPAADPQAAAEAAPENTPALIRLNLTPRQQRKLWRHVESIENFWETLREMEPGVIARLAAMALERRWEIIFLTKRPETAGLTAQLQTQRWLESKGFARPSVFVVRGSRGLVAAGLGLDFVIDDRPENCLDVVVDSKARAILVWRDDERLLPANARRLGIGMVRSIDECLAILGEVDAPGADRPGMIDRVRRLLGLGEPAAS